ncbi:two-component hybrid sensor and regulator [Sulfurimonas gotlandica GD1]|uniref:histidine kinase n=1 Tax=Sulfurimonas gotlandica (strain DSM 19862 / JCM 16533 / GD1) TaxID=929558 RepID=B6BN57_SULGG|nr:hybrid sensor histidine kinase/response regulator [Sulfurimonas gotlandica]EDZ61613.1 response regulator receiver [Sulfurimonas gotlandica GD1]EHP30666.1 two-component hybrid sensor and regulator [Sulfurimonas gotlandica GD1]
MQVDFYSKNILIVDDNKVNILVLEGLLEDEGYTSILSATSALQAYDILKKNNIDMILLDVMMPQIDGIEACRTIRQTPNYNHIPIIMITADISDETLRKSFEAGANDYLNKPVNMTNLKVRIESQFMNAHKDALILNQNRLLAVNETVQMLAHQWRQPLSIISTITMDIAVAYEFDELTAEHLDRSLNNINNAVQELSKTLDEFRQISNIEESTSLNNINDTVNKSIKLIEDRFESNHINLETDLQHQQDILYFPNELVKILISIYTNSIEAFKKTPHEIKKFIKISTKQNKDYTYIEAVDNAGGIDKDLINRIFDPYVSTKDEKNAVGLGLYNAFNILKESMHASIKVTSQNSQTTVTIKIPNTK